MTPRPSGQCQAAHEAQAVRFICRRIIETASPCQTAREANKPGDGTEQRTLIRRNESVEVVGNRCLDEDIVKRVVQSPSTGGHPVPRGGVAGRPPTSCCSTHLGGANTCISPAGDLHDLKFNGDDVHLLKGIRPWSAWGHLMTPKPSSKKGQSG